MTAGPSRRPRWRRWLWWTCVLLVAARLLLALLLPWLLGLGAHAAGLQLDYRAAQLSLSGLSLRLDDVVLRDAAALDAPPLLTAQEVFVDASTWQLLHGQLVVVDVALTGSRIHVVQDAEGRLRLPAAWQGDAPMPAPVVEAPAAPLRFDAPVQVVAARVDDLQFVLDDAATATQTRFTFDAAIADLGRTDRPGSLTVHLFSPGRLDRLDLQANLTLRGEHAEATWQAAVRGLRPPSLPWFDDPRGPGEHHVVGLDLDGKVEASVAQAGSLPTLASTLHLRAQLDEREQLAVDLQAGPSRTTADHWDLPIQLSVRGDDLVDELRLVDTHLTATRDETQLAGALRIAGANLRRLQPWLTSMGVTMPTAGLGLQAKLAVALRQDGVTAEVTDLTAGEGEHQLVLPQFALRDVRSDGTGLHIGAIAAAGPHIGIQITAAGELDVLGVRLTSPTVRSASTATPPAPEAAPFVWPQLAVDHLAWRDIDLQLVDHSFPTPAPLNLGVELSGEQLVLGRGAAPGKLAAKLRVPDAIDLLRADVEITPSTDAVAAECQVKGTGISARSMTPWLQRAGIAPMLQDGALRALLSATVTAGPSALHASARLDNVRFEDGGEVLLSLHHVDGRDLTAGTALDLGSWTADEPYLVVHRQADGTLAALGLQFGATPPAPAVGSQPPPPAAAAAELHHGAIELRRGVLRWIDASRPETADVSLGMDLRLDPQAGDQPTAFRSELRLEPGIGKLGITGSLARAADGGQLDVTLAGERLRGAGLQALLPAHIACTLEDGLLRAGLRVQWHTSPALAVTVAAEGLSLQDRGTELFALDALELQLPEVSAERVHVASATMHGLRAAAASTPLGLQLLGLRIGPAAATPAPAQATADATPVPAARGMPLPALRLDALDLQIERLVWRERGDVDGEPLTAMAHLTLVEPWATAADPTATAPCRLLLQASAAPLCQAARLEAQLAPFAIAPTLDLAVQLSGIDTTALTRVHPSLAGTVTGTCTAAEFATSMHGRLDLRRRDPLRFDLGNPFGGELMFEATELKAAAAGPSLLRVDEIAVDLRAFDPRSGDVLLRSIEVEGPQLQVENTPAGLELMGLRLPPPPAAEPTANQATVAAPRAPAPVGPAPELAVDRVQVQGLALTFTDRTTEPPTVLPLTDSDLKVQNLSTRAQTQPRPIAFTIALHGGNVALERRVLRSSALAGLLGSAAEALTGSADRYEMEQRPLVDEISIAGQVQLFPRPTGEARMAVDGFELPALRGLGKAAGVDIADGIFDLQSDVLLRGASGIDLRARPTFTFLSLSEPPGGPLSTYLKLPAPLDTVLFALRNENDEHVLPLHLQLPAEGLSGGAVGEAAAEALVRLLADAVASAAFRVTGVVTGAVGLGGATDLSQLTGTLDFAAGDPLPSGGSLDAVLAAVADDPDLVIVLHHELGHGDLRRAAQLASPPPDTVADAVAQLQVAHSLLLHEREQQASRTAALYGAGRMQEALAQLRRLQQTDARLGALQQTQEAALRMQLGASDRAIRRQTRDAAVAMATNRLETVQQQIRARLADTALQRVEWRPPRGVETAGLSAGGRVVATVRRRKAP